MCALYGGCQQHGPARHISLISTAGSASKGPTFGWPCNPNPWGDSEKEAPKLPTPPFAMLEVLELQCPKLRGLK